MTLKEFPSNPTLHGFRPPPQACFSQVQVSHKASWVQLLLASALASALRLCLFHSLALTVSVRHKRLCKWKPLHSPPSSLEPGSPFLPLSLPTSLPPSPSHQSFTMWHWLTWNCSRSGSSRTCGNQSCPCLLRTDPKPASTHPAFSPPSCHRPYFYLSFWTIVYIVIL